MTNRIESSMRGAARRGAITMLAAVLGVMALLPVSNAQAQRNRAINIPAGTTFDIRIETPLNTSTANQGDEFKGTVLTSVAVGGVDAIPRGSVVVGRVLAVTRGRSAFGQPSGLTLKVDSIQSPSGVEVNVLADLADSNGAPLVTVDNLPRGAQLSVRVARGFAVDETFWGGGGPQDDDVLDTPATISQVQTVLRDLGYYTGRIDGRMNPATRAAISAFQRDQRLTQTGFLDRTTLDRLGLISEGGAEVSTVNVISADAQIRTNNVLVLRIVTQGTTGMTLFEDHFRQRDTLHVYVRGIRGGNVRNANQLEVTLQTAEWQGVQRIVVHSAGNDIVIRAADLNAGGLTPTEAAALEAQVATMLNSYAQALGLRYNRFTGQIEFSARMNYRENETELLFALNALASTSKLYTQLLRTSNDAQAIAGATDILVLQSKAVDRAVSRTKSGRAAQAAASWANLRDDFASLEEMGGRNFNDLPGYR